MVEHSTKTDNACSGAPLVSVVTPFYNTAEYLSQCIESVLAQTYTNFEYILFDNCSSDGSSNIAEIYARKDKRIRFIKSREFVSQLDNFNRGLREVSKDSQYCKIVCADDYLFPECLDRMVLTFKQSESIGIVSSYSLMGNIVIGSRYPYPMPILSGKEVARRYFNEDLFAFGSPTTVMYRSSIVRSSSEFYDRSSLHADTEKCLELFLKWDLGFVHQILSFIRTDNELISSVSRTFEPELLDRYIMTRRYAQLYLDPDDAELLNEQLKRVYYRKLATAALALREKAFWRYHENALQKVGETLDKRYLAVQVARAFLRKSLNLGNAITCAADLRHPRYVGKSKNGQQSISSRKHLSPGVVIERDNPRIN